MKYLLYLSIFSLSVFYSCSTEDSGGSAPTIGPPAMEESEDDSNLVSAPDFTLDALDGGDLSLAGLEDKVVAIFFFGYSCPPCISAGPTLTAEIHDEFGANPDFQMIGIDVWDGNTSQVQGFRDNANAPYPLGLMGSGVSRDFESARDRLVILNRSSKIVFSGRQVAINDLDDAIKAIQDAL